MKYITLRYKEKPLIKEAVLIIVVMFVLLGVSYSRNIEWTAHADLEVPEASRIDKVASVENNAHEDLHVSLGPHSGVSRSIQLKYQQVGSPLADRIPWLVSECGKRDLNPKLVAAVMAKESGWGKNCHQGNCFGYGALDSGNMSEWFGGDFETITLKILDAYQVYYNVDTAQEMSDRGYNFHAEWVVGVNQIISYFN